MNIAARRTPRAAVPAIAPRRKADPACGPRAGLGAVLFWLAAAAIGGGAQPAPAGWTRYEASQLHMGTLITVVLYATDQEAANRGLAAAFDRIRELDERLSDYRTDSEVSRLSRQAPTCQPVRVSEDLWRVLVKAQWAAEVSGGAFDPTVGPLTKLWRRARRQRRLPDPDRLREALQAVGVEHLQLLPESRSVRLLRPGMRLDLGGVAKGYAAQAALRAAQQAGCPRTLINAGGDVTAGQRPPGRPGWKVALAQPHPNLPPDCFLRLEWASVATSGDAYQFVEIDGVRYSHIVDPRTGLGLTTRGAVSVIAPDGAEADALASAVSVLGPEQGLALVERLPGVAARIVLLQDDHPVVFASRRLSRYLWPTDESPAGPVSR